MMLSVLVATRNRADAIAGCLDSISASLASAAPLDAEIVIVDNGSGDETSAIVKQRATTIPFPVRLLFEPRVGISVARNLALRMAKGELLAITDDDCRLCKEYVSQLLHHDASDGEELVLRGGRIELGDPTDLPLTIKTTPTPLRFNRRMNPAMNPTRRDTIIGQFSSCNMTMRRTVFERLGLFDERFGPGAIFEAAEDGDYLFRAYLADITLEYVPDMTVLHYHGRKQKPDGFKLMRSYSVGSGALYAKYFFKHPNLCRPVWWDVKAAAKEILSGSNTFFPIVGFSHKHRLAYTLAGAVKYFLTRARLAVTSTPQRARQR
jgi:glycosyltransferase involved in cell wall biosynthesis